MSSFTSSVQSLSMPGSPGKQGASLAISTANANNGPHGSPVTSPSTVSVGSSLASASASIANNMPPLAGTLLQSPHSAAPGSFVAIPPSKSLKSLGEEAWKRCDKVNGEMFALTYGCMVAQLCKDLETSAQVNDQLFKMGYNVGVRIVDDFLAKSGWSRCADFREAVQVVALVSFKMFLNCTPKVVAAMSDEQREFGLVFDRESGPVLPLLEFVHLPGEMQREGLRFLNLLPGVLKGALEMLQMDCECWLEADGLRGDERTEIRVRLIRIIEEELPPGE